MWVRIYDVSDDCRSDNRRSAVFNQVPCNHEYCIIPSESNSNFNYNNNIKIVRVIHLIRITFDRTKQRHWTDIRPAYLGSIGDHFVALHLSMSPLRRKRVIFFITWPFSNNILFSIAKKKKKNTRRWGIMEAVKLVSDAAAALLPPSKYASLCAEATDRHFPCVRTPQTA